MKIIILVCFLITSCSGVQKIKSKLTGDLFYKCSKNEIEYIKSDKGHISLSVDKENKPICK